MLCSGGSTGSNSSAPIATAQQIPAPTSSYASLPAIDITTKDSIISSATIPTTTPATANATDTTKTISPCLATTNTADNRINNKIPVRLPGPNLPHMITTSNASSKTITDANSTNSGSPTALASNPKSATPVQPGPTVPSSSSLPNTGAGLLGASNETICNSSKQLANTAATKSSSTKAASIALSQSTLASSSKNSPNTHMAPTSNQHAPNVLPLTTNISPPSTQTAAAALATTTDSLTTTTTTATATASSAAKQTSDDSSAKPAAAKAPRKRKPRPPSSESTPKQAKTKANTVPSAPTTATVSPGDTSAAPTPSPPKRSRKKKSDEVKANDTNNNSATRKTASAADIGASQNQAPSNGNLAPTKPPSRSSRKKKGDSAATKANDTNNNLPNKATINTSAPGAQNQQYLQPYGTHPQLLSVAGGGGLPLTSNSSNSSLSLPGLNANPYSSSRQLTGLSPLDIQQAPNQDPSKYYSLTVSPYSNHDYTNAASLMRPSLSRLFTTSSSSAAQEGHQTGHGQYPGPPAHSNASLGGDQALGATSLASLGGFHPQQSTHSHNASSSSHYQHSEELSKAFEDLRDNTWTHLSRCILEQAQQFDIPSLIGTLYTLRSENEKLVNKVRDLSMKRDQLVGINARLELPGPMLTQHLSHTSPNFSSVVAGLTNSPKSLPNSSPSPAMNKSPLVSANAYTNHIAPHGPPQPSGSLGPPNYIDRSSPHVGAPHPAAGVSNLKSSTISTPSPPTGALLAHGANNRASLMTVNNSPYISSLHPSINPLNQLGPSPASSSYYSRQ